MMRWLVALVAVGVVGWALWWLWPVRQQLPQPVPVTVRQPSEEFAGRFAPTIIDSGKEDGTDVSDDDRDQEDDLVVVDVDRTEVDGEFGERGHHRDAGWGNLQHRSGRRVASRRDPGGRRPRSSSGT